VDMGPSTIITNRQGFDFTVYSTNSDTYSVSITNSIDSSNKEMKIIGTGQGITSFDLENCNLDSARYIQISCTQDCPVIDAVECEPRPIPLSVVSAENYSTKHRYTTNSDSINADTTALISGEGKTVNPSHSNKSTAQREKSITHSPVPSF